MTTDTVVQNRPLPGAVFFLGNLLLLLYAVPLFSLAVFFGITALLIECKRWIEDRERGVYLVFSILVLLLALLYYHSGARMLGEASPLGWYLQKAAPSLHKLLQAPDILSSLGLSYCFLRSVYALLEPRLGFWDLARYYFFAPTFFSGPVFRPGEYLSQVPAFHIHNLNPALVRITFGAIKVSVSQVIQGLIPLTSAVGMNFFIQAPTVAGAWAFAFVAGAWLYLNFSGISDICIGLGRLCNIKVPENFNNPFAARDITDFWRRWHITLADWLRTCIYTPLARILGKRVAPRHLVLLVMPPVVTMLVCGLWHGLAPGYIIWGAMHGLGLVMHQAWKARIAPLLPEGFRQSDAYSGLAWLFTHAYISLAWVFFFPAPEPSLRLSLLYLCRMFGVVSFEVDLAITQFPAQFLTP